jgi:hypothetical protein
MEKETEEGFRIAGIIMLAGIQLKIAYDVIIGYGKKELKRKMELIEEICRLQEATEKKSKLIDEIIYEDPILSRMNLNNLVENEVIDLERLARLFRSVNKNDAKKEEEEKK